MRPNPPNCSQSIPSHPNLRGSEGRRIRAVLHLCRRCDWKRFELSWSQASFGVPDLASPTDGGCGLVRAHGVTPRTRTFDTNYLVCQLAAIAMNICA